jgi:ABC-type multidrug transport system fused ATPase/permease subunit
VVIEDGKIAERGNHLQLIEQGGIYKKLTVLQAFA